MARRTKKTGFRKLLETADAKKIAAYLDGKPDELPWEKAAIAIVASLSDTWDDSGELQTGEAPPDAAKLETIRLLLERGADPNVQTEDEYGRPTGPILTTVIGGFSDVEEKPKLDFVKLLLSKGADPWARDDRGWCALDWAVTRNWEDAIALLLAKDAPEEARLSALGVALREVASYKDPATGRARVERILPEVKDVNRTMPDGWAPVHAAALDADPWALEALAKRGADLQTPLGAKRTCSVSEATKPGGGLIPQVDFAEGLTALDLVSAVRILIADKQKQYDGSKKTSDFDKNRRSERLARLTAVEEWLGKHGAKRGTAKRGDVPAFKTAIDPELLALARAGGADVEALQQKLDRIALEGMGPWGYTMAAIEQAPHELCAGDVGARSEATWLGWFLRQEHVGFDSPRVRSSEYPKEAAKALKLVVGKREDELLCLWKLKEGVAKVCRVSPREFEVLGDDVVAFVKGQVAEITGGKKRAAKRA